MHIHIDFAFPLKLKSLLYKNMTYKRRSISNSVRTMN